MHITEPLSTSILLADGRRGYVSNTITFDCRGYGLLRLAVRGRLPLYLTIVDTRQLPLGMVGRIIAKMSFLEGNQRSTFRMFGTSDAHTNFLLNRLCLGILQHCSVAYFRCVRHRYSLKNSRGVSKFWMARQVVGWPSASRLPSSVHKE